MALGLRTLDDEGLSLAALRGRPVLVTMLTTWAEPGLFEVPRVKAIARDKPDLAVLCIVLEKERELARIFRTSFDLTYPVATVDDLAWFTSSAGPFGEISIIPTSVLLDREGRIVARMDGMWPPRLLEEAVDRILAR